MSGYCYGRRDAVKLPGLSELKVYAAGKLPKPPVSVEVPDVAYPIDANDRLGDCTIAGVAHLLGAWNAEVGEHDNVPDEQAVVATYMAITGGADTGCNEADVLGRWHTAGLFDTRIAGFAPVDPTSLVDLHQAVAAYGGCYLGIMCPPSAQEQFAAGQAWTYQGGQPEGGHCIVALGYEPDGSLLCATWGGVAQVTAGFLAHYLEEAWAIIPQAFVEAGKGPEVDLAALRADLGSLAAQRPWWDSEG